MRKTVFKITGVVALATLMVLNIQFSKLDKDSKISLSYLKNMAFAQGGEDDGGDDGGWFWKKKHFSVNCGQVSWQRTTFYGSSGEVVGKTEYINGQLVVSYYGSYTSSVTESGTTGAFVTDGWNCIDGWDDVFCSACTNPCLGC